MCEFLACFEASNTTMQVAPCQQRPSSVDWTIHLENVRIRVTQCEGTARCAPCYHQLGRICCCRLCRWRGTAASVCAEQLSLASDDDSLVHVGSTTMPMLRCYSKSL